MGKGPRHPLSRPCLLLHYSLPASAPPRPQSTSLLALGDSSLSSPDPASARLPWHCSACAMLNEPWAVLCVACDRPRGCKALGLGIEGPQGAGGLEPELARGHWACQSCTFENEAAAVLCVSDLSCLVLPSRIRDRTSQGRVGGALCCQSSPL